MKLLIFSLACHEETKLTADDQAHYVGKMVCGKCLSLKTDKILHIDKHNLQIKMTPITVTRWVKKTSATALSKS